MISVCVFHIFYYVPIYIVYCLLWYVVIHLQDTATNIEKALLSLYPEQPLSLQELSAGQILHGTVHLLSKVLGQHWYREVGLTMGSNEQRSESLSLFPAGLRFIACILCDDSHWGLLIIDETSGPERRKALVYDGLYRQTLKSLASALLFYMYGNLSIPLSFADVGEQHDVWSCGLRVIVSLQACLEAGSLLERIDEAAFAADNLHALVSQGMCANLRDLESDSDQVQLREAEPLVVTPAPSQRKPTSVQKPSPAENKACEPKKSAKRKLDQHDQSIGLKVFTDAGMTHNIDFQLEHQSRKCAVQTGHWQKFMRCLGKNTLTVVEECRDCVACQNLFEQCQSFQKDTSGSQLNMVARNLDNSFDESAHVPVADAQMPVAQPQIKGKGKVDLREWLQTKRPGIYDLLPGPKVPLMCRLCKARFKAFRFTTAHYVENVHEASDKHTLALKGVRAVSNREAVLTTSCKGICLRHGDGTGVCSHKIATVQDSARRWIQAGSPNFLLFSGDCDQKAQSMWHFDNNDLILKSKSCLGSAGASGVCSNCSQLANSKKLILGLHGTSWNNTEY